MVVDPKIELAHSRPILNPFSTHRPIIGPFSHLQGQKIRHHPVTFVGRVWPSGLGRRGEEGTTTFGILFCRPSGGAKANARGAWAGSGWTTSSATMKPVRHRFGANRNVHCGKATDSMCVHRTLPVNRPELRCPIVMREGTELKKLT